MKCQVGQRLTPSGISAESISSVLLNLFCFLIVQPPRL
jgi:hypothetical protein